MLSRQFMRFELAKQFFSVTKSEDSFKADIFIPQT
jgi:hypothetical protein